MSDHNQCCDTFDNFENEIFENESVKKSDELLIDAVRAYPHLYNYKDPNFKNHLMKKNSWKEITLTVNIPGSLPSLFVSLFINKKIHLFIVSECQI